VTETEGPILTEEVDDSDLKKKEKPPKKIKNPYALGGRNAKCEPGMEGSVKKDPKVGSVFKDQLKQ